MLRVLLLVVVMLCSGAHASESASAPKQVLQQYFDILTSRQFDGVGALMKNKSMMDLKNMMDTALKRQLRAGNFSLQKQLFGKRVTMREIEAASASFYLESISAAIRDAAETQHLFVDKIVLLGEVSENDSTVHYVARLYFSQDSNHSEDIYVYTLTKDDGEWRLQFPPTIRQFLTVIESSVAA